MQISEILSRCDHTVLLPTATEEDIRIACEDAMKYRTASVCIPPSFVSFAKSCVGNRLAVCTVIGFPNGYSTAKTKLFEAEEALANGADEIDMVINIGLLKAKKYDELTEEIRSIKKAVGNRILKVIIEACLLTDEEKIIMCELVGKAGADYIKTSTGFSVSGATPADIDLMKEHVNPPLKIKAAGGITTLADAKEFIERGADRLGTSRIVKLVKSGDASGEY